jgi:hypothetical protein
MMDFALLYPSYSGNGGKRMEECGLPVKHGYITRVVDWQSSSFHRFVQLGIYPSDWAGEGLQDIDSVGMD